MKEKPTNPAWERLLYIVAESGRKDLASFARSLGLKSASGLYSIRRSGVIGKIQARRIHRVYPRFPVEWLMGAEDGPPGLGAGTSCISVNGNPIVSLPVYSNLYRTEQSVIRFRNMWSTSPKASATAERWPLSIMGTPSRPKSPKGRCSYCVLVCRRI